VARKSRRRPQNRPRPRPQTAGPAAQPQAAPPPQATPAPTGAAAARAGGESALVRAVEMSLGPPPAGPRRGRGQVVFEGGDAAIPLDRVPYFTGDLKRLGITAAGMIALLVIAAVTIIPQVVK
jgi:hypothetical protein